MIRYKDKGKAQIVIGGKDYGTVEIGHEDLPGKTIDKISEALMQIQTGEQPHLNLILGEGKVRRGITIVDGIVYAVEKNGNDMDTCRIDYECMGLLENAPIEKVIFEICEETIRDFYMDIGRWAEDIIEEDDIQELKRKRYILAHLKAVVDLNGELKDAREYYKTTPYEKLLRETNLEIEMLQRSIGDKVGVAEMT